jgi:hypothetical protein
MGAAMKIGPGLNLPPEIRRQAPRGEAPQPPSGTFNGGDGRAARFIEYGMFGRQVPAAESRPAVRHAREMPLHQNPHGESTAMPAAPASSPEDPGPVSPDRTDRPAGVATTPTPRHGPSTGPLAEAGPASAEAPDLAVAIEDWEVAEPAARSARPMRRQSGSGPPLHLILREENGTITIVAGSPAMDPESRMLLRRLAEAMLARRGLALAYFQLNGALLAPISLSSGGGLHGTRTS